MSLKYEAVFFIKDEDENIVKQTIKKIKKIVKEEKCNILKTEDFGTKKLAYKINNQETARYFYMIFSSNENNRNTKGKIDIQFNTVEEILKHIVLQYDDELEDYK